MSYRPPVTGTISTKPSSYIALRRTSEQVVAETQFSGFSHVFNKNVFIRRTFIVLRGYNPRILVWTPSNDIVRSVSGVTNYSDWDDNTYSSILVPAGQTTQQEVWSLDLGQVYSNIYVYVKASASLAPSGSAASIRYSSDGTTWSELCNIITGGCTTGVFKKLTLRYIDIYASNSSTTSGYYINLYSVEALDPSNTSISKSLTGSGEIELELISDAETKQHVVVEASNGIYYVYSIPVAVTREEFTVVG